MAETLGLAANLAAVIGAGLGLSKFLHDFASVLGSASRDVKSLAIEITLFCSVLRHTQSVLSQIRAFRISFSAIQTAQDVIDRCHVIFDDLDETIKKLQKGQYQLDLVTRVKWFFKEKRVLLVHEQLRTCGATLNLMLTTLLLAQKIATRRNSSITTQNEDEDAQDRLMTHSLFMAQQAATERLAIAEEEDRLAEEQTAVNGLPSPQLTSLGGEDPSSASQRRHRCIHSDRVTTPIQPNDSIERLSTILSRPFSRLSVVSSTKSSFLDDNRLSILQTNELLQHWTDQSDPLAASIRESSLDSAHVAHNDPHLSDTRAMEDHSPAEPESSHGATPETCDDLFKSFRVGLNHPCLKVLPDAFKRYNIQDDWRKYDLLIAYGDQERPVGLEEKPLPIFTEYGAEGKRPALLLRKRTQSPSLDHSPTEYNFI